MRKTVAALFLSSALYSVVYVIYGDQITHENCGGSGSFFHRTEGHVLDIIPVTQIEVVNSLSCLLRCQRYNGCKAINFNSQKSVDLHSCHILATDVNADAKELTRKDGWDFYRAKTCQVINLNSLLYI